MTSGTITSEGSAVRSSDRPTISTATVVMSVVVAAGVIVGLLLRLWFIYHTPSSSDEAVSGLVAQAALHGHFTAFSWGPSYGGTAEPDLTALAFLVFGQSGVVEELVVAALSGFAALLTWRVARRIVPSSIAPLAGVLAWTAPAVAVRNSMTVFGFRGVTLVCGMGLILFALRILDGDKRLVTFAALGLFAGVGWWSSPEIIYFVLPTLLLVVFAIVQRPSWRAWWRGGVVAAGAAVIGALPWLWVNIPSHFASLHQIAFTTLPYSGRLRTFFQYSLPMEVGLRYPDSGSWILRSYYLVGLVVVMAVLVGALVLCLARGGKALAIGLGVLAFPFLYAISAFTGDWQDGRYATYLVPLLALTLTIGVYEAVRRWRGTDPRPVATMALSAIVALSLVLSVIGVHDLATSRRCCYTSSWGNPDAPTMAAIAKLEAAGVTAGYGGPWVPYKLDFLSQGRLTFTPVGVIPRSISIYADVVRRQHTAWIFVPRNKLIVDSTQFVIPILAIGPAEIPEAVFIARLRQLGIHYRVVETPILNAVIPDRTLTPYEANMPCEQPGTIATLGPSSCRK